MNLIWIKKKKKIEVKARSPPPVDCEWCEFAEFNLFL